jgi:hypothetical protein
MKQMIVVLLILFVSVSFAGDGKKYGKALTLQEKTRVSEILASPEEYEGKKVLIEGMVVDVCSKRGCWIEVASDKPYEKIKVKVKDGEIVFPIEEKGKTALVEGELYKISLTKEQAIEQAKHEAEEHGTKFDPASVTGPVTYYQLKGIGAEIK